MTTRIVLVTSCLVAMATLVTSQAPQCSQYPTNGSKVKSFDITPSQHLGNGVALILGVGGFALLVAFGWLLIRWMVYRDVHLLDTFFNAGGNNSFVGVASTAVSRWLWAALYLPTFGFVYLFGVVGQYLLAAITSVQLLIFSIVAWEFRVKAPGAKTFLQVIRCRFGTQPHISMMIFAIIINLFIMGMTLAQGGKAFSVLLPDLSEEVAVLLLSVAASVFSVVGGEGAHVYMGYFASTGVVAILMCYFFSVFYPMDGDTLHAWGFSHEGRPVVDVVCEIVQCARTSDDFPLDGNLDNSVLTFSSLMAFVAAAAHLIMCFSFVFTNQSFWSTATYAEPQCAVYGYLLAGITFFAIPFTHSFVFGIGDWVIGVLQGEMPVTSTQVHEGYVQMQPLALSQLTLGASGDILMSLMILVVVMMTVSAQIHSLSAIFMYDIYQT